MQERRVLLNHEQDDLDPVEGRKDHAEANGREELDDVTILVIM